MKLQVEGIFSPPIM